jgi:non-ribosomal peptide synthetase component F
LRNLAKEEEATMFMVLFTIFNVLLAKLSGQEDIIVGTGVAGRRHANLQHIIGMFVNTLPLRNYPLKEKTFKELLKEVKTKALEAFENQDYQFEDLAEKVVPERDNSRNPLVEVVFVLQSEMEIRDIPETETSELEGSQYRYVNTVSKFDITLNAVEAAERLLFTLEYRTKLFKKETIEMFIDYFKEIVSAVINEKEIQLKDIAPANGLKAIKANIIQQEQGDFGF